MMKTTIIADLKKYAQELPEKPAVSDKNVKLTYAQLLAKVEEETVILKEHGVACADKIAVLAISKVDYVISYLAVQYLPYFLPVFPLLYPVSCTKTLESTLAQVSPDALFSFSSPRRLTSVFPDNICHSYSG